MGWSFNVFSAPLASPSPTTQVRYATEDFSLNGTPAQVRINGTGFTYDGTTGLLNGGSITSLELWDVSGGGEVKLQTLTLGAAISGASFFTYFNAARTLAATIDSWGLQFVQDDNGAGTFTDTLIEFGLADGSKIRIIGSGFGTTNDGPNTGTVTTIQHTDQSNVVISGHEILNVGMPLGQVAIGFGNSEGSYDFFSGGNDTLTQNYQSLTTGLDGGLGNDIIDGGTNPFSAMVDYHIATSGVNVTLTAGGGSATGGGGNDTLINITGIGGSAFADTLTGNNASNSFFGGGGNDAITGNGGNDFLFGDEGNDSVFGGAGDDNIQGWVGDDLIDAGGSLPFNPGLNQFGNIVNGGPGSDTIVYSRQGGHTNVNDFGMRFFQGNLSGGAQVPAVTTNANGFANLQLAKSMTLAFLFVQVEGIDRNGTQTPGNANDNLTGFHIHSGAAGANGPVVWDIAADGNTSYNGPGNQAFFQANSQWSSGEGLSGQLTNLQNGNLYVNIHTTANPGGEIRGQLVEVPGGFADKIDVSALGISNLGDLSHILFDIGGTAQLVSTYDGLVSTLILNGVTVGSLTASDFIFGGLGDQTVNGTGNADHLFGGDGADILYGLGGNDTLIGGAATDVLFGGLGDDHYIVDTFLDYIAEEVGEGIDSVTSFNSYIFHANVENVQLAGTGDFGVQGNELDNSILGNSGGNGMAGGLGNDFMSGNAGSDTLMGDGGNDTMDGGTGSDVFFQDVAGDVVQDPFEAGVYDILWTMVTRQLPNNVEILILNGGVLAIDGTGNAGAGNVPNLMLGNNAANTLTTFGGDDIILGRDGNDVINSGGGQGGVEIIAGGLGADTLTSGGGHDFFAYENIAEGGDTITDFSTASGADLDILDLRPMFFTTFTNTGGVTTVAQAVASGHLTFTQAGANTQVFADADGGANNNVLLATLNNTTAASVQALTLI
jgi:Ca2+-binding RTX toxin-like protein